MDNKKKILRIFDITSFVSLIAATILVLIFEFGGSVTILQVSMYLYGVCALALLAFSASKIAFVYKKEETKDEMFILTKSQKAWLFVRTALSVLLFCLITVIIVYI